jgi:hypothetical protein
MTVPYDIMADVLGALDKISRGKVPTVACDEQGLAYSTFVTYTKKYPQLSMLRQEAEDRLYDLMAEALPNIFNHHIYGVEDPKEASVVSSNIKWLLERRRQKAYGAHSTVEHHLSADREVLDALQKAKARAQGGTVLDTIVNDTFAIDHPNVIDVDVITSGEENEEDIRSLY